MTTVSSSLASEAQHAHHTTASSGIWPGVFLTALIATAAFGLHDLPGITTLSPLILSIPTSEGR